MPAAGHRGRMRSTYAPGRALNTRPPVPTVSEDRCAHNNLLAALTATTRPCPDPGAPRTAHTPEKATQACLL